MLVNSSLKPSQVSEIRWLYCRDEIIEARTRIFGRDKNGKWMMFFKKGDELDGKWKLACDLYRQGKLTGITGMKVSTELLDPIRSSDDDNGLICFYCGPCDDEETLMKYGNNLLEHVSYKPQYGTHMLYKSDAQTRTGTFATGQRINSLYKIRLSDDPDDNSRAAANTFSRYTHRQRDQYGTQKNYAHQEYNRHSEPKEATEETNWRNKHSRGHENEGHSSVSEPKAPTEETNWRLLPRKQNYSPHPSNCNWRERRSDPK